MNDDKYEIVEAEVEEIVTKDNTMLSAIDNDETAKSLIEYQTNNIDLLKEFKTFLYHYKDEDRALYESFGKYNGYESVNEIDERVKLRILNSDSVLAIKESFALNDHITYSKERRKAIDGLVKIVEEDSTYETSEDELQQASNKIKASEALLKATGIKRTINNHNIDLGKMLKKKNKDEMDLDKFYKNSFDVISHLLTDTK